MELLEIRITRQDLLERHTTSFPTVVKAVVDLGREVIAVDAAWHADLELMLLESGSAQEDLWGINLLVFEQASTFIAYESLINIRPAQRNFDLEIQDQDLRDRIRSIVDRLIDYGQAVQVREPAPSYGARDRTALPGFGCASSYPCLKHHHDLTLEKWRSFTPWKRILMIANEFGRAKTLLGAGNTPTVRECYERALELFHITVEAGRHEEIPADIIAGLLRLRERTAQLLVREQPDPEENLRIREALIRLDPEGYRLFQPARE